MKKKRDHVSFSCPVSVPLPKSLNAVVKLHKRKLFQLLFELHRFWCVCSVISLTNTCARFICEWFLLFPSFSPFNRDRNMPFWTISSMAAMTIFNDATKPRRNSSALFHFFHSLADEKKNGFVLFMDFIYDRWKKILRHIHSSFYYVVRLLRSKFLNCKMRYKIVIYFWMTMHRHCVEHFKETWSTLYSHTNGFIIYNFFLCVHVSCRFFSALEKRI